MSILTATRMEEIEERHLLVLIENKVPESRDLEYKRDPIGRDDRAKKEFLKDVTAFANTAGGHIVIGMAEADGVAAALPGTDDRPADEEIRRLESILGGWSRSWRAGSSRGWSASACAPSP
jgi:predicted HTH transcriptional regulator